MENQHRKIMGYRELSQEDIDLMNRIKAAGRELLALRDEVVAKLDKQREVVGANAIREDYLDDAELNGHLAELNRLQRAEPHRWASIAKTDLQTGVMALVRAVAQPTDC